MRAIYVDLSGLSKAEALCIAKEAFLAEANVRLVRNRLEFLRNGHSFEMIGTLAEIQDEMLGEDLRVYLAELGKWLDPQRPALRVVHGGAA